MAQKFNSKDPNARAAHVFVIELRTRIASQHLPFQHGDMQTALISLRDLFGIARRTMCAHPGCQKFADEVIPKLNQDLRWMTAKWHRLSLAGELKTRDGAVAFRRDLMQVQEELRTLIVSLNEMAYGPPDAESGDTQDVAEQEKRRKTGALTKPDTFGGKLEFGIPADGHMQDADRRQINAAEAEEIAKRRALQDTSHPPGEAAQSTSDTGLGDAAGLAFSGGGIRSASFCLGIAQVLADKKLLTQFDLLSTVSGGGYTGSFLVRRIADGSQEDVAAPNGPDAEAIQYLRRRAAYLDAGSLRKTLPQALTLLAGMILNWTVPAAIVAVLTMFLFFVNPLTIFGVKIGNVWENAHWISLVFAVAALSVYAWVNRDWLRLRHFLLWGLWGLAGGFLLGALLLWGYEKLYTAGGETQSNITPVATAAIISAGLPLFSRLLPMIGTVWVRRVGNNIALTLAAISIPLLSILFGFWLYSFSGTTGPLFSNSTHPILAGVTHTGAAFVLTSVLVATAVFRVDINWTGPHWLYREGLRRTFVQLPEPDDRTATREPGTKGIKAVAARWKASISQLMHARSDENRNNIPISEIDPQGKAPYLLMNAVVNLPSSKLPKLRERKGDFFLFSRRFCGSPVTRYTETPKWVSRNETLDLATAVAISGAAVAPQMGLLSISAARALLSFLNVRLGFWVLNPHLTYKGFRKVPGAWQLLREMFAYRMDADEPWVMLTDGAHLENSGVYELLRRRCRFIVAIDASADPNGKFDTLLTLARHARIDFGIRIEPKLDDLRVDPDTGLAPAHGIMCDVIYPDLINPDGCKAVMLYIKTAVTGNEPALIQAYQDANPAFPNQSTLDQFFDEHQFEAYRRLGVHSAESLFEDVLIGSGKIPDTVREWLLRLYLRIPPEAPDDRTAL